VTDYGYARVSTDAQDLTLQLEALERAGVDTIYQEKISGAAATLPVRAEVLRLLRAGDRLTVHRLDRLGRSTLDVLAAVRDVDQRGATFRCVAQPVDTSGAMGRAFLQLLAVFAELERSLIFERTAAGKRRRAEEGLHPGAAAAFGTTKNRGTIIEHEAALLIEAAERLSQGQNMSQILNDWHARGITAAGGGRWQASSLRNMLTNPRVTVVIGQEQHQAMVQLFGPGRSQRRTDRKKIGRPAAHLLGGILTCQCGQAMYSVNTGKRQRAYRCRKSEWSGGRSAGCGRVGVSEPAADREVADLFIAAVCSEDFARALDRRRAELLNGDVTAAELDAHRVEIQELEQVLPTRFGTDAMRERHAELQRIVNAATSRLMQRTELQEMTDLPRTRDALQTAWDGWSTAQRRQWLKRIFLHITVLPATRKGRGSDVAARLEPRWRI
jgi:DNA invertase Pin-like site-specific DNA recombinase